MDTGAYMANQMDRQIEAGLELMDEIYAKFSSWIDKQEYAKNEEDFVTALKRFNEDIGGFLQDLFEQHGISKVVLELALNI